MTNVRLSNEAWEAVLKAHSALLRKFEDDKIWSKISMREYDVLYTLRKAPGPLRLCELQDSVLLSQPALSRLVERLEKKGLIERGIDLEDKRALSIRLTHQGASVQKEVGRLHAKSVNRHLSVLSEEEMLELLRISNKLTSANEENYERL